MKAVILRRLALIYSCGDPGLAGVVEHLLLGNMSCSGCSVLGLTKCLLQQMTLPGRHWFDEIGGGVNLPLGILVIGYWSIVHRHSAL